MDVAKLSIHDQMTMGRFAKAWFSFREKHTLTEDGQLVPSLSGSAPCPDTPEAQMAFLHHIVRDPVKVTYRASVRCEDCRGTGKKFIYDGLSPTELTHRVCGGTGKVDSLVVCMLSYTGTPPPRLPSANQRAYAAALKLANDGQAIAALEVAARLADGRGVEKDLMAASQWCRKALLKGEPKAAAQLGGLYEKAGAGFELNQPFAVALAVLGREMGGGDERLSQLSRACTASDMLKGYWYGQHLVRLQKSGRVTEQQLSPRGIEKEVMMRFDDMLSAARREDRVATYEVGMIQLCGLGAGGIDAISAYGWFAKSAKAGNPLGYYALGSCFESGVAVRRSRPTALLMYKSASSLGLEFPAAQSAKTLEAYCPDALAKLDEVLAKVRNGGLSKDDLNALAALPDVEVPVVVASSPSTVTVTQDDDPRRLRPIRASGSGLIFTPEGHVFTNNHVVQNASYLTLRVGGIGPERTAQVVCVDPVRDLAILKIVGWSGPSEIPYATPSLLHSAKAEASIGMRIFTIGYPIPNLMNSSPKYTAGDLSSLDGSMGGTGTLYSHNLQMSCPIQPGNSGGPLVLEDGRVVGVVVAHLTNTQNANYAVRIEFLRELASKYGILIPEQAVRIARPIQAIEAHSVQVLCR